MHPHNAQKIRVPGEVAAKSTDRNGQALRAHKLVPGDEQHRQVHASLNKWTPGKVQRRRVHPISERQAKCSKGKPNKRAPGKGLQDF